MNKRSLTSNPRAGVPVKVPVIYKLQAEELNTSIADLLKRWKGPAGIYANPRAHGSVDLLGQYILDL